jgi:hypothetical protein
MNKVLIGQDEKSGAQESSARVGASFDNIYNFQVRP